MGYFQTAMAIPAARAIIASAVAAGLVLAVIVVANATSPASYPSWLEVCCVKEQDSCSQSVHKQRNILGHAGSIVWTLRFLYLDVEHQ